MFALWGIGSTEVATRQMSVEFRFGVYHTLEGAEAFEVRATDIGDESAVGIGDTAEEFNLPRMVGAHFHDGQFRSFGDGEQRQRHAEVVVEVALGSRGLVTFVQHGVDELLSSRLAIGTSDADDGNLKMAAVLARQLLQGLQHVGDDETAVVDSVLRVADDTHRGTLF